MQAAGKLGPLQVPPGVDTYLLLDQVARTEAPSVTLGMRRLIAQGVFSAVALSGVRWTDVDTPEDYAKAEMLLSAQLRRRASVEAPAAA